MPAAPVASFAADQKFSDSECQQLHRDGYLCLGNGMPEWELVGYIERLFKRYDQPLKDFLDGRRKSWQEPDTQGGGPGCHRPGGLVARLANEHFANSGLYVYAAHPSQSEEEENEEEYAGPRWYVSCMEAAMTHYRERSMAPPPPEGLQSLLWPETRDKCRPWLTEAGWTVVPESSDPQILHADICSYDGNNPRKPQLGRYHHFAWKLDRQQHTTTQLSPGAFTEGVVQDHHFDSIMAVRAPAIIFDSEMLHRGGPTKSGVGWTSTLTIQVSSGTGWPHLAERVNDALMWYTQPLGWSAGDAVDARVQGAWKPALVESRDKGGWYSVTVCGAEGEAHGLRDKDLRYRRQRRGQALSEAAYGAGESVSARFEGRWHEARVTKRNADGTYKVAWKGERTCTDGLEETELCRRSSSSSEGEERRGKRRRVEVSGESLEVQKALFGAGWAELPRGLPEAWRQWALFGFVERYHDLFHGLVVRELEALRSLWRPLPGSPARHGAFAAAKVSERLKPFGVTVYSPGESQAEALPYESTGPRWYVSVTAAALRHFGDAAPAPPAPLHAALFGHESECRGMLRARGLGWALAPPDSDPQALHCDIWGTGPFSRTDHTRWPHILWKRQAGELCTTEIVPGAFTRSSLEEEHYKRLRRASAPAVVLDSEMLHRGAATAASSEPAPAGWRSSLSLELCSPSGWDAWETFYTGGTTKDPDSPLDWRMLCIQQPWHSPGPAPAEPLPAATPELAPLSSKLPELQAEQRSWEFGEASC